MSGKTATVILFSVLLGLQASSVPKVEASPPAPQGTGRQKQVVQSLFDFLDKKEGALEELESNWELSLTPMLLEAIRFFAPDAQLFITPESHADQLWELLEKKTGQKLDRDLYAMMRWIWEQDYEMHPFYPAFKAEIHAPD